MPDLWMPGATRVPGNNGLRAGAGGGKGLRFFTHHTFEAPYTYSPDGIAAMRFLHSRGSTAHFVFHPTTGAIVQGLPANQAARTLAATTAPGYDVNRYGDIHMQVEVIAYARRPWTLDLTPAGRDALARLLDYLRSWSIPDQWAYPGMTGPPATYAQANAPGNRRLPTRSGHTMHSKWPVPPGVDGHWDPGAIVAPWTFVGTTRPSPAPPPRAPEWPAGWIAHAQELLNALGYTDADGQPLDVDDSLGPATEHATRTYQADAGLDVDGRPGADTTASLEETMSKIDELPGRAASAVWGTIMERPGTTPARADTILRYAAHRSQVDALAEQLATLAGRVEALTEAAGQTGTPDLAAVEAAAARGAERVLAGYRLTLERAETEEEGA